MKNADGFGKYPGKPTGDNMPFASYPSAVVYKEPRKTPVQQVIWGDWLALEGQQQGEWVKVQARGEDGWMRESDIQPNRLLEVSFIDVGQGDGCFIVTPDDKFFLMDAGQEDNMYRFLSWRFGGFKKKITFQNVFISHPDADHYLGFKKIFEESNIHIETIYHNGIVERVGKDTLGPRTRSGRPRYLSDIIEIQQALENLVRDPLKIGQKRYPNLLKSALAGGRVGDIRMLCSEDDFVPDFTADQPLSIRVLGPVPEPGSNGKRRLRWFTNKGKTKNGHSLLLQLKYNHLTLLLGGDLNIPSEQYLLEHYTGLDPKPRTVVEEQALVRAARRTFECDIAKACHHGSADFTELFLQAVNPIATVVSSGDNEPHSHPRPDALGSFGRYGRGRRPLIFSTELARSPSENIKQPDQLRARIKQLAKELDMASTERAKASIQKRLDDEVSSIERSIAIYGTINLRSDGEKVIIAQKLERQRSKKEKWAICRLEPGPDGRLRYVSKHLRNHPRYLVS